MKPIERGSRPDSYQALNAKMAKVVRAEMAVAGVLMAAGLVVAALIRVSDYTATTGEFLARLLIGDGAALVYLGILSLLLIPVSCLLLASWFFLVRREYQLAGASILVLLLLALGAILGLN